MASSSANSRVAAKAGGSGGTLPTRRTAPAQKSKASSSNASGKKVVRKGISEDGDEEDLSSYPLQSERTEEDGPPELRSVSAPEKKPQKISLDLLKRRCLEEDYIKDMSVEECMDALLRVKFVELDREMVTDLDNIDMLGHQVDKLYLQHNMINAIDNLDMLPSLRFLCLFNNNIEKLENISHLSQLEFLDISNNKISSFEVEELPTSLVGLNMAGNPCTQEEGYRARVVAWLPALKFFDNIEVTKWEKQSAGLEVSESEDDDEDDEEDDDEEDEEEEEDGAEAQGDGSAEAPAHILSLEDAMRGRLASADERLLALQQLPTMEDATDKINEMFKQLQQDERVLEQRADILKRARERMEVLKQRYASQDTVIAAYQKTLTAEERREGEEMSEIRQARLDKIRSKSQKQEMDDFDDAMAYIQKQRNELRDSDYKKNVTEEEDEDEDLGDDYGPGSTSTPTPEERQKLLEASKKRMTLLRKNLEHQETLAEGHRIIRTGPSKSANQS